MVARQSRMACLIESTVLFDTLVKPTRLIVGSFLLSLRNLLRIICFQ